MVRRPRHAIAAPVHVRAAGEARLDSLELTETVDIGEGGLCIVTARARRVGETLRLRLMLPCRTAGMSLLAVVVWTGAQPGGELRCGLRLLAIDLRDALLLRRYLASLDARVAA
jgi:hypothetical protein